jgi:hypothetical protein
LLFFKSSDLAHSSGAAICLNRFQRLAAPAIVRLG